MQHRDSFSNLTPATPQGVDTVGIALLRSNATPITPEDQCFRNVLHKSCMQQQVRVLRPHESGRRMSVGGSRLSSTVPVVIQVRNDIDLSTMVLRLGGERGMVGVHKLAGKLTVQHAVRRLAPSQTAFALAGRNAPKVEAAKREVLADTAAADPPVLEVSLDNAAGTLHAHALRNIAPESCLTCIVMRYCLQTCGTW